MFAAVFLTMAAYYMVKPAREGWIAVSAIAGLSRVEIKAYSSLAQSLLLIGAVAAYARIAARRSRATLLTATSLACAGMLLAFWALQPGFLFDVVPGAGIAFYLWVGMFGVFIVAQFWSFATDLYADERGRRLLPLIAIGGTAGAAAGSWTHDVVVGLGAAGAQSILALATLPILTSAALSRVAAMEAPPRSADAATPAFDVRRVLGDRFVLAAGVLALLLNWATANGENLLFQIVQQSLAGTEHGLDPAAAVAHTRAATSAFYGDLYLWTNLGALAVQMLLAARLVKHGGLAVVLLALPVLALLASALAALAPALAVLKWVKVAEQATDYSLNQTARQLIWLPASAEMKYESKPTVDTIFVRIGDGLAALTVLWASHAAAPAVDVLLAVNVVLIACWIVAAIVLVREHGRLVAARAAERVTRAVRSVRRAARVVARRARRAARTAMDALAPPGDVPAWRLALLPIGRGHPPPGWLAVCQS